MGLDGGRGSMGPGSRDDKSWTRQCDRRGTGPDRESGKKSGTDLTRGRGRRDRLQEVVFRGMVW